MEQNGWIGSTDHSELDRKRRTAGRRAEAARFRLFSIGTHARTRSRRRGDSVAEVLRKPTVPIVFATGNGDTIDGLADGALILEKPYTQEKLENALSKMLPAS